MRGPLSSADTSFAERYGPWALVAGASEGLGASFSRQLAGMGLNLLLLARRSGPLEELAESLRKEHGVEVRTAAVDLADADLKERISALTDALDLGLFVYNAAYAPIDTFLDCELEDHLKVIDVNVRGPLTLSHYFGKRFVKRGRGGIILMSSMSGMQGTAMVANYAASKAYDMILAEGLWHELGQHGVDVLACVAGATLTPNYVSSTDELPQNWLGRPMDPDAVTTQALRDLGKTPTGISGGRNRFAAALLRRLLPRRAAIRLVSKETEHRYRKA
jgi:short-subunit dehydrogenase